MLEHKRPLRALKEHIYNMTCNQSKGSIWLRMVRHYRPHHEKDIGFALHTVLRVAPFKAKYNLFYLSRAAERRQMMKPETIRL